MNCLIGLLALAVPAFAGTAGTSAQPRIDDAPFVRDWLICGPFEVDGNKDVSGQRNAFDRDWLKSAGGESGIRPLAGMSVTGSGDRVEWRRIFRDFGDLNFAEEFSPSENRVAYAATEIPVPKSGTLWIAVGSDDAVKVWIDGRLVLDRFVMRPLVADADLIPVRVRAGRVRVLAKVLNGTQGWGLTLRLLDHPQALLAAAASGATRCMDALLSVRAVTTDVRDPNGRTPLHLAAGEGRPDAVALLLRHGADPNVSADDGTTPLDVSRRAGRVNVTPILAESGAVASSPPAGSDAQVDAIFSDCTRGVRPGAAVGVVRGGKLVLAKGYGYARLDPPERITPRTRFYLASVSKAFTAMAVMMLAEAGKIGFEDSIRRFVPECPESFEPVTINHLLHHTSGIPRWMPHAAAVPGAGKREALLASLRQYAGATFEPGRADQYSNLGYWLLGVAVERASGMPYASFMTRRILVPLNMLDTVCHHPALPVIPHRALGYLDDGYRFRLADSDDGDDHLGPGGIYSTIEDLARWIVSWRKPVLVSEQMLARSHASARLNEGRETGYGFAWQVGGQLRGRPVVQHNGQFQGFRTQIQRFPEDDIGVIVLSNQGNLDPYARSKQVSAVYLQGRMRPDIREPAN